MYTTMKQVCLVLGKERITWGGGGWWVIEEIIIGARVETQVPQVCKCRDMISYQES